MFWFFHRGLSPHLQRAHAGRTRGDGPNHHAFGTFVMPPADSASRAGVMPKASGDPSSRTLGKNIPTQRCVWYGGYMPTVLRIGSFRFHFYTDEGSEPPHIHVRTPDGDCKFWLEPSIFLASNRGVRSHDLRQIERLVFENQQELKKAYYERHPR